MLNKFCSLSQKGEAVWINDVRAAFDTDENARPLTLRLTCLDGSMRGYDCPVPHWSSALGRDFVKDYLTARIFNVLSCWSGRELTVYFNTDDTEMSALVEECIAAFGSVPGLKKVLNIAARLCRGTGNASFEMNTGDIAAMPELKSTAIKTAGQLGGRLRAAVDGCAHGAYCGMDVGGTDIKLAVSLDGRLIAVKEYDWNPAANPTAEGITAPMLRLIRLMRACVIADGLSKDAECVSLLAAALRKDASGAEMDAAIIACESSAAELPLFSGIGLSFPDVVISDRILGGETPKTKGMRENTALDYETEFAKLAAVGESMARYCMDGVKVRIINDGPMAAFSAAAELAQDGDAQLGESGVIAHSLGTDLGSGWIKVDGEIPAIPLELYDLLLDLGSAKQKEYAPEDMRSVRNENSGLAGVRRYLGQAAAYRMAQQLEPALLDGFTEKRGDVLCIITAPEDMRKPCLEHIMNAAADGDEAACEIFRRVGANLAQLTKEMEYLLDTGTDRRFLFGRFVKNESCFRLIQEGFAEVMPEISLIAADDGLARSGLMRQLAARADVTVAQFAQAVSAIYYSRM